MKRLLALFALLAGCTTHRVGNMRVELKPITSTIGPAVQISVYKSTGELIDRSFVAEKEND